MKLTSKWSLRIIFSRYRGPKKELCSGCSTNVEGLILSPTRGRTGFHHHEFSKRRQDHVHNAAEEKDFVTDIYRNLIYSYTMPNNQTQASQMRSRAPYPLYYWWSTLGVVHQQPHLQLKTLTTTSTVRIKGLGNAHRVCEVLSKSFMFTVGVGHQFQSTNVAAGGHHFTPLVVQGVSCPASSLRGLSGSQARCNYTWDYSLCYYSFSDYIQECWLRSMEKATEEVMEMFFLLTKLYIREMGGYE